MDDTTGAPAGAPQGSAAAATPPAAVAPAAPPQAPPTPPAKKESEWVPRNRWDELVTERNGYRDLLAQHEIDPQFQSKHAKELADIRTELENERLRFNEDRSLFASGLVEDEARDVAKFLHSKLPAEGRPSIGEWLTGLRADGASVPKALQPYLGGVAAPAAVAPTRAPSLNAGADSNAQATGAVLSAEAIRAIHQRMIQSGSTTEYDAMRDQIFASLKKR